MGEILNSIIASLQVMEGARLHLCRCTLHPFILSSVKQHVHHKHVEITSMAATSVTEERCCHIVQYLCGSRCSGKALYPDGFS